MRATGAPGGSASGDGAEDAATARIATAVAGHTVGGKGVGVGFAGATRFADRAKRDPDIQLTLRRIGAISSYTDVIEREFEFWRSNGLEIPKQELEDEVCVIVNSPSRTLTSPSIHPHYT